MSERTVEFTSVDCGNMNEDVPDAPPGGWTGLCSVKKAKTQKDGYPMLILEWRLTEAEEDDNASFVGGKVTDFVTFFPKAHQATRMARTKLKQLCEGLQIEVPTCPKVETWDDLSDFIDALDGTKGRIWTKVAPDKSGKVRTSIHYTAPAGGFLPAPVTNSDSPKKRSKKG